MHVTFPILLTKASHLNTSSKTDKTVYSLRDTLNASFKNKSEQNLFLNYQFCTTAEIQKHENDKWESIPIPVFCTAEVKTPIQVSPGANFKIGIALHVFDKDNFKIGTYRLNVLAIQKNESQQQGLTSNNFKILK